MITTYVLRLVVVAVFLFFPVGCNMLESDQPFAPYVDDAYFGQDPAYVEIPIELPPSPPPLSSDLLPPDPGVTEIDFPANLPPSPLPIPPPMPLVPGPVGIPPPLVAVPPSEVICPFPDDGKIKKFVAGVVQSGGNSSVMPISGAKVTLYIAMDDLNVPVGEAITNELGEFHLEIQNEHQHQDIKEDPIYYLLAKRGSTTHLLAMLGEKIPSFVTVNELTTVAAAFALAQFFHDENIYGNELGLQIGSEMSDNLVALDQGNLSSVILSSPNADQTNAMRSLSSLANLLSGCVRNNVNACSSLFNGTTYNNNRPTNTLQAAINIAHYPTNNVDGIYDLSQQSTPYTPFLQSMPDAWTMAIKFNASGNEDTCPFGGPGGIAITKEGYLWLTNNTIQGTPNSTNCLIVLKRNGKPADGKNDSPISPVFGGGVLGGGFGITLANDNTIWEANFGWGSCATCLPNGSVSQFSLDGKAISGPNGYQSSPPSDLFRVQGIVSDKSNNIWMASFGNDKVVVFKNGDYKSAFSAQETEHSGPFALAIAPNGYGWVTNTGLKDVDASLTILRFTGSSVLQVKNVPLGKYLKAIVFDSTGHAWIASQGNSTIYQMDSNGNLINGYNGGGISGPWGLAVDGNDQIWIANFESETLPFSYQTQGQAKDLIFGVSRLCGNKPETCPPGLSAGDPISPPTGYTLPSAGSEVLLGNGEPLNGPNEPPSFDPLMRQTYIAIDQAGNVWVVNNWKPNPIDENTEDLNPGGDGMVTFLGLAKPPILKN